MLKQPAIQMDFVSKIREAVIRKNQITIFAGPFLDLSTDLPYEAIEPLIPILDNVHSIVEEHMLHPIEVIENAGKHAFMKIIHQVLKDLNATIENGLAQIQELIIINATVFEAGSILGPTQGEIGTHFLPELLGESHGACNG